MRWLVFSFLILLSYILIQPPFEGFDENAHYSRVLDASRNIATQFSGPQPFDSRVHDFVGPQAYSSGNPPFSSEKKTYDHFYNRSLEDLINVKKYDLTKEVFTPSTKENWQYQHPPLYYLLTGFISRFSSDGNLVKNVVAMRLISILLTVAALFFCYRGLVLLAAKNILNAHLLNSSVGIFALCFPMFFFEFARIGNDALIFLCLGIAFYFSAKAYKSTRPHSNLLWMSLALALGLWTKAVVLPLIPGFAIFVIYCLWISKSHKNYLYLVRDFIWTFLLPIILGLTWYVFLFFKFHDLGLGTEARDLSQSTGLINGLALNFSFVKFIRGLIVPLASFIYAGSWSLVRAPLTIYFFLSAIHGALLISYITSLIRSSDREFLLMPIILISLLYAGLAYHVLVSMALSGLGTSGGWYLYVLTPWILMAITVATEKIPRYLLIIIQVSGLLVSIFLFAANTLIYSGFITKGDDKSMKLINVSWLEIYQATNIRLEFVSYPQIAYLIFFIGCLLAIFNMRQVFNRQI